MQSFSTCWTPCLCTYSSHPLRLSSSSSGWAGGEAMVPAPCVLRRKTPPASAPAARAPTWTRTHLTCVVRLVSVAKSSDHDVVHALYFCMVRDLAELSPEDQASLLGRSLWGRRGTLRFLQC